MKKRIVAVILCCLMCLTLVACGSSSKEKSKEKSTETHKVKTSKKNTKKFKPYFKNNVAENADIKIEITSVRVLGPGEEGNQYDDTPSIAFWYTATNKSNKEYNANFAWSYTFYATQDNNPNRVNELNTSFCPDESLSEIEYDTIKKGGSVQGACAYPLSDSTTPVTLIAKLSWEKREIGRINYSITG